MATAQVGLFWPKPAQQVSPEAWLGPVRPAQAAWPSKPGPAQYTKNQDTVASIYFIHFKERNFVYENSKQRIPQGLIDKLR